MKMRLMHVKPDGVNRTWDILLQDDRQNARVHLNMEGTEFIDLVILESDRYMHVSPALRSEAEALTNDFFMPEDNKITKLTKLTKTVESSDSFNILEHYTNEAAQAMRRQREMDFPF